MESEINDSHSNWLTKNLGNLHFGTARSSLWIMALMMGSCFAVGALAQEGSTGAASQLLQNSKRTPQAGHVYVPESSKEQRPGFAHTNYVLRSADGNKPGAQVAVNAEEVVGPESTTLVAETPASMGCLYVGSPNMPGCVPQGLNGGGGGPSPAGYGAIAIVDAYDNPNAASDLATFNAQWPLPAANFTKIYANGNGSCTTPASNKGWALEESLDIEWAHVFAPNAAIVLVEACSSSTADLFYAEQVAFRYIVDNYPQGGQVSNSWQGGEFRGQSASDPLFADWNYVGVSGWKTHILAFASSGDGGFEGSTTGYPSGNPWVISAGGTSVLRDSVTKNFVSEACWAGSGGGTSSQETFATSFTGGNMGPWANFQFPIFGQGSRRTPDLSSNADPASGVYVYSGFNGGWFIVGGTSVSSPSLAGIVNRAGNGLGSVFLTPVTGGNDWFNTEENNLLYSQLATASAYNANFYDVQSGSNGTPALPSYDLCTGVGTPRGLLGK
jgi:kumamolisin